jgi:hypothetical protein
MPSLAKQFAPGGPSLTICGCLDGFIVVSDHIIVAGPFARIIPAEHARRELMAHRAMAAESLRHVLSTKQTEA